MKPSLQLKVGQSLTMTPQLQQAIRLLQLSSLDLQMEIQQALESNPMLELEEEDYESENAAERDAEDERDAAAAEAAAEDAAEDARTVADSEQGLEHAEGGDDDGSEPPVGDDEWSDTPEDEWSSSAPDADWNEQIPEDLPVDSSWDDVYTSTAPGGNAPMGEDDYDFDDRGASSDSLGEHLLWQLNLAHLSERDEMIARALVDGIGADGLLSTPVAEICEDFDASLEIELDEVVAVLHMIQQLEPVGVGARDLGECLLLQLKALPAQTPWHAEACALIEDHLSALGARDYNVIMRKLQLDAEELGFVLNLIQSLNPRPGASIDAERTEYVIPDVVVRKDQQRWVVELNGEAMPKLRINNTYAGMVKRADTSADNTFLKNNLQEARWFLKSLQSRNETLMKVASKIVEHQRGFLEYGPEAMKPLVLHDIAEAIGMHESTVSRVTTRKYMHTPRGVFELKYFFSSHVGTTSGGEVSSTAIRALIKKLTDEENPKKPLSDSRIANMLADQDIKVARRTIAKYRESMSIPPSNERKRLI